MTLQYFSYILKSDQSDPEFFTKTDSQKERQGCRHPEKIRQQMEEKANQDRASVRLKGLGDSLYVTVDPTRPAEQLQKELDRLFTRMKHLAINARVILDTGEQDSHGDLIAHLGKFLKNTFGVGSVLEPPRKRLVSEEQARRHDMESSWHNYRSDVLMLAGRVRSGQQVTARKHLLIMGDVNPGAVISAGGDILVMGRLRGIAAAGQPDNQDVIILALDFQPTQIQIGGVMAAGLPPSPRKLPEFAYMENGAIVVEDYLDADPFGRLTWPQVR